MEYLIKKKKEKSKASYRSICPQAAATDNLLCKSVQSLIKNLM